MIAQRATASDRTCVRLGRLETVSRSGNRLINDVANDAHLAPEDDSEPDPVTSDDVARTGASHGLPVLTHLGGSLAPLNVHSSTMWLGG
jgi:hypothetical protein